MIFYQITRPLAYLAIKDRSKWQIDWFLPCLLAAATVLLGAVLPIRPQIFEDKGILDKLSGLLEILPGFYIAALAAIATFNKTDMDQYMPDPTPTVEISVKGTTFPIKLSRRRMLCMQFGYLSFISLCIFILGIASNAFAESVKQIVPASLHAHTVVLFMFVFMLFFWHMISITFFGLYQLSDRMHQPQQE